MSQLAFDAIFEACCVSLEQGASLEEALAGHPELKNRPQEAAELREALETVAMVATLRQPPPPAPRLQGEIRDRFLAEVARSPAPAPVRTTATPRPTQAPTSTRRQPARPGWGERLRQAFLAPRPLAPAWGSALIILALAAFSLGTLSVAEAALPGDGLYGIKRLGRQVDEALQLALHPGQADQIQRSFDEERVREVNKALELQRSTFIDVEGVIVAVYRNEHVIIIDQGLEVDVPADLWDDALMRSLLVRVKGTTDPERGRAYATFLQILRVDKFEYGLSPQATPTLRPTPTLAAGKTPAPRPTRKPTATRRPATRTPRPTNTPQQTATATATAASPTATPPITATATWTSTPSGFPGELTPTVTPAATETPAAPDATATETPTAPDATATETPTAPDATATETPTPIDVTATPTSAQTPTPTVVDDTATPTAEAGTDVPTETPLPPTETPLPPTETPAPTPTLALDPTAEPAVDRLPQTLSWVPIQPRWYFSLHLAWTTHHN